MISTGCRLLLLAGLVLGAHKLDAQSDGSGAAAARIDSARIDRAVIAPSADSVALEDSGDAVGETGRHRAFASVAVSSLTSRDEGGSPLTYRGIGFPFFIGYEYHGSPGRHHVAFSYRKTGINAPTMVSSRTTTRGTAEGTLAEHTVDYSLRRFSYEYSRVLFEPSGGPIHLLGGILWDNILFFRYYSYAERPLYVRESSLGVWDGILSLNLTAGAEYLMGDRSAISARIYAPFLAFLFRPRYSIQDDELIRISFDNFSQLNSGRSRFVTLGELMQLGGGIGYGQPLDDHVALRLDYSFFYTRVAYPRVSTTVENALAATIEYRF